MRKVKTRQKPGENSEAGVTDGERGRGGMDE